MTTRVNMSFRLAVVLFSISMVGMAAIRPVSTKEQEHPFVQHLESKYRQYLAAQRSGDVETYRRLRTKNIIDFMEDRLKQDNRLHLLKDTLIDLSKGSHELESFRFDRCDLVEDRARLTYIKDSPSVGHIEAFVVIFHFEGDSWRVGKMVHAVEHSKEKNIEEFLKEAYSKLK